MPGSDHRNDCSGAFYRKPDPVLWMEEPVGNLGALDVAFRHCGNPSAE